MPGAIQNFTLQDYNGKNLSLSDYKDSVAMVILFIATECPVSNAYNERMENVFKRVKEGQLTGVKDPIIKP